MRNHARVRNPVVCFACRCPDHIARFCSRMAKRTRKGDRCTQMPTDGGIPQPKSTTNRVYSTARNRKGERGFSSDSRNPREAMQFHVSWRGRYMPGTILCTGSANQENLAHVGGSEERSIRDQRISQFTVLITQNNGTFVI
jgi:hypothetical protein